MVSTISAISAVPDGVRQQLDCLPDEISLIGAVYLFLEIEMLGKSSFTKAWYDKRLLLVADSLGRDRPLSSVMETDLFDWYRCLSSRSTRYPGGVSRPEIKGGLSVDTLHGYVRACKRFFKWLAKRGILAVDISADLSLPRLPRRGKKGIPDVDRVVILEAAAGSVRDTAILRFLDATGARRGGVSDLRMSDLSLDNPSLRLRRRVTVREKGNKERVVLLTPLALAALEAWLKERPPVDDDHVFLGYKSGAGWQSLAPGGVSGILRRYKERLGIAGRCSPHQWRHRFCRKRLQEGMGLKQVSQLAGHESIVVTAMFYSDFDIDDLQDAYDKVVKD